MSLTNFLLEYEHRESVIIVEVVDIGLDLLAHIHINDLP